jgi:hypothetical protein
MASLTSFAPWVADLGVAHIAVGGKTDRLAVGLEAEHQLVLEQAIEGGGIGNMDAIAVVLGTEPDAVHDDGHHRSREGGIAGKRLQGQFCHSSSFNGSPWRPLPFFHMYFRSFL